MLEQLKRYVVALFVLPFCLASGARSDELGDNPPVRQTIGMMDVLIGNLTSDQCHVCHTDAPDRHHLRYGQPIPAGSLVPFPDADGNGVNDTYYVCGSCHAVDTSSGSTQFIVERDCVVCHTSLPHHSTPAAKNGDCVSCHGDIVDNPNDGHYVPNYPVSKITPDIDCGVGLPLNSRGNGAGACDYCHDDDGLETPIILTTGELHHGQGFSCTAQCHFVHGLDIRGCERCHGPDSLHNIQADSPNPANPGTVVVGGEDAGYGHVGRDHGPGDSDCWGCHGYAMAASSVPVFGPVVPTIYNSDVGVVTAGRDTTIVLNGVGFTSVGTGVLYESKVLMTAADGTSVTLKPDEVVNASKLAVTIPRNTRPGNYKLRAIKGDVSSNPVAVSVLPAVNISSVTSRGKVVIRGSGFGGHADGAGTSVIGATIVGRGKWMQSANVPATIVSWTDEEIVAEFHGPRLDEIMVTSVFGAASAKVQIGAQSENIEPGGGDVDQTATEADTDVDAGAETNNGSGTADDTGDEPGTDGASGPGEDGGNDPAKTFSNGHQFGNGVGILNQKQRQ